MVLMFECQHNIRLPLAMLDVSLRDADATPMPPLLLMPPAITPAAAADDVIDATPLRYATPAFDIAMPLR